MQQYGNTTFGNCRLNTCEACGYQPSLVGEAQGIHCPVYQQSLHDLRQIGWYLDLTLQASGERFTLNCLRDGTAFRSHPDAAAWKPVRYVRNDLPLWASNEADE